MGAKDVDESAPKYSLTLRKLLTNIFLRNFRVFLFLETWTQLSTTGLHQPILLLSYSPGSNYPTPVTGNLHPENDLELGPIFHIFFSDIQFFDLFTIIFKGVATDMRYFARGKLFRS